MALTKEQLDAYIQGLYDDDGNLSPEDYQKIINYIISNGEPSLNERDLIQVRRGDKADLPTLAQGEQALTLDTEEFFIGGLNGNINISKKLGIDPDTFTGTDGEKLQQAIDYAINTGATIILNRMYTVNDDILLINKALNSRDIVAFLGTGGGIFKSTSGYLFSSTTQDTGDIYFINVKFKSTTGAGTVLFDANKLIRCFFIACSLRNVDTFVEANNRFIQSFRIDKCNVTGGSGWLIEMDKSYDFTFENNLMEHRANGIRNTNPVNDPDNNNIRILNNVMEGLSGVALKLGACFGGEICGNYMEANEQGYIDLTLNNVAYHNGLTLGKNTFQQTPQQLTDGLQAIKIHRIGSYGVNSFGNTSTGVLYELIGSGTGGRVISTGDVSFQNIIDKGVTDNLRISGRNTIDGDLWQTGSVATKFFDSASQTYAAGEVKLITIATDLVLKNNDIITAELKSATGSNEVSLLHLLRSGNNIQVRVKNDSAGSQDIAITAKVLQIIF